MTEVFQKIVSQIKQEQIPQLRGTVVRFGRSFCLTEETSGYLHLLCHTVCCFGWSRWKKIQPHQVCAWKRQEYLLVIWRTLGILWYHTRTWQVLLLKGWLWCGFRNPIILGYIKVCGFDSQVISRILVQWTLQMPTHLIIQYFKIHRHWYIYHYI